MAFIMKHVEKFTTFFLNSTGYYDGNSLRQIISLIVLIITSFAIASAMLAYIFAQSTLENILSGTICLIHATFLIFQTALLRSNGKSLRAMQKEVFYEYTDEAIRAIQTLESQQQLEKVGVRRYVCAILYVNYFMAGFTSLSASVFRGFDVSTYENSLIFTSKFPWSVNSTSSFFFTWIVQFVLCVIIGLSLPGSMIFNVYCMMELKLQVRLLRQAVKRIPEKMYIDELQELPTVSHIKEIVQHHRTIIR